MIYIILRVKETFCHKVDSIFYKWHVGCLHGQDEKIQELKVNITETEFVIMDDTSSSDCGAVILKVG